MSIPVWKRKSLEAEGPKITVPKTECSKHPQADTPAPNKAIWKKTEIPKATPEKGLSDESCLYSETAKSYLLRRGHPIKHWSRIRKVFPAGKHETPTETLSELRTVTPTEFEEYCARRLSSLGWDAVLTVEKGDFGVDILAYRENRCRVVQAKRIQEKYVVNSRSINEAMGGCSYWGATEMMVVSSGGYSRNAQENSGKYPIPCVLVESENFFENNLWF